mmetsp:Transcript_44765/g.83624  ORF Transcript_44765/g.83624 Transcript_44765/m.83624 type:complete len:91 (-) Transcript_44765:12-284(-)
MHHRLVRGGAKRRPGEAKESACGHPGKLRGGPKAFGLGAGAIPDQGDEFGSWKKLGVPGWQRCCPELPTTAKCGQAKTAASICCFTCTVG